MKIGDKASLSRKVTEADIEECAKLTQDQNPLHMDETFAKEHRFGKRTRPSGIFTRSYLCGAGEQIAGTGDDNTQHGPEVHGASFHQMIPSLQRSRSSR